MNSELVENLSAAVSNGRTDIVRSLLGMYENGSIEIADSTISVSEILLEQIKPSGTLLHIATKLDHVDIVRTLLSLGGNPSIENAFGETPVDMIQSQSMTNVYVDELLKCAAKSEINCIHNLINAGIDVNSSDSPESKNTALHWAVCFGKPEAVQCLLEMGSSPKCMNGQGLTALHEGVNRKNIEIIKLLLSHGADPLQKCSQGKYFEKSALDLAEKSSEIYKLLLTYVPNDPETEVSFALTAIEDSDLNQSPEHYSDDLNVSTPSLSISSEIPLKNSNCIPLHSHAVPSFLSTPLPLITDSKLHLLWPQPQKLIQSNTEGFKLQSKHSVHIILSCSDFSAFSVMDCWSIHEEKFKSLQKECVIENISQSITESTGDIICHLNPSLFPRMDSYKLVITKEQIRILASNTAALHYALCTLEQLFSLYQDDNILPSLFIHDWPEFQHRGVLLDFSIGARKPTLETLKVYIQTMSSLKIKQIHCYFRYEQNAFNNPPFTSKEFIELSKFCSQHFITLVPTLDVGVAEKHINVKECITEPAQWLMSLFSSKNIHFGPNLSKILLQEVLLSKNSKIIWDMLLLPTSTVVYLYYSSNPQNSEWLQLLPLNCILIDYGYQVEHDYDVNVKAITQTGCNVCIGMSTTSWGSVSGSSETAISCIYKAASVASVHHCFGVILSDWQTLPHHPAFCFTWPDIVLALGLSWNSSVHQDYLHIRLPELLNLFVYQDSTQAIGYLNVELGRLETYLHRTIFQSVKDSALSSLSTKGSLIHQLLVDPDSVALDNVTNELLQQSIRHIKKFELELQKATPLCYQHGEVVLELRLAMDLFLFACRLCKVMVSTGLNPNSDTCSLAVINVGISNLPPIARTDLANKLLALIEQFRAVWLSRNQPSGLQMSLSCFHSLLRRFIPNCDESFFPTDENLFIYEDTLSPYGNEVSLT